MSTDTSDRRSLHLVSLVLAAAAVGIVVGVAARWFAGGSCPGGPEPGFVSSCGDLIASLAWRVGAVAAGAVLLFGLISQGLARTASLIQDERRTLAEEAPEDPASSVAR